VIPVAAVLLAILRSQLQGAMGSYIMSALAALDLGSVYIGFGFAKIVWGG